MSSSNQDPIVILGAARTPMGGFQGDFSSLSAHDLGGAAIKAAIERSGIAAGKVDEVLFGNCLMAEAVRRYEAIYQKAPDHTLNLQNWAIADYTSGNYPMAWKRLKLAEATPQRADIDPNFVKALEAKMPRPAN